MVQQELLARISLSTMTADEFGEVVLRIGKEVTAKTDCKLDIPYGTNDRHKLDLFLPDAPTSAPVPVLMYMHGGYWSRGYKDRAAYLAPAVTCAPAILVAVGFRLATEVKYPGPVDDCRAALKWVYENISSYGGDPNRIFVGGHSSGGHLSALMTLQRDELREVGLSDDVIKGCFPVSGVFDLSEQRRIDTFLNSADEVAEASPVCQVAGNTVPFFVIIGENDGPEHRSHYHAMVKALQKEQGPVECLDIKEVNHFGSGLIAGDTDGVWATKVREWMNTPPIA